MKNFKILFGLLILNIVFLVSFASAEFLSVKTDLAYEKDTPLAIGTEEIAYKDIWTKYQPIEIKDVLGLGNTLFKGAITNHTETCGNDISCLSEFTIYLPYESVLIEDLIFYKIIGTNKEQRNIRSWNLQYYGLIDDYENVCVDGKQIYDEKNDTYYTPVTCSNVLVGNHYDWVDYKIGDKMKAGTYNVRLIGSKNPSWNVDWVIKTQGKTLDEWAVWGNISLGATAEVTLNSPADGATIYSNPITFNCSANVTNGANITNISLFDNSSGTWALKKVSYGEFGTLYNTTAITNRVNAFDFNDITYAQITSGIGSLGKTWTGNKSIQNVKYKAFISLSYIPCSSISSTETIGIKLQEYNGTTWKDVSTNETTMEFKNCQTLSLSIERTINISNNVQGLRITTTSTRNGGDWVANSKYYTLQYTEFEQTNNKTITFLNSYANNSSTIWSCQACDSDGDCGFATSNRTFIMDSTAPQITLNYPTGTIDYGAVNGKLQLNLSATDINLDKVWYNYNGTNTTITGATSGVVNLSNITLTNQKNVTIYANDTVGNLNATTFSWDYRIFENNRTFNLTTYETKNESFIINITANSSLNNVYLNYNGIDYLMSKTGNVYLKMIPIELINADVNRTFYFKFNYAGNNITSTSSTQLIKNYVVNWTGTKQYLNISIKDEYDNSIINSTTLDSLFNYYIDNGGYSNINSEIKIDDGIYGLSSTPEIPKWYANGRFYYFASGYQPRYFFIDNELYTNSSITQKTLYLLLQTDGILVRYKIYDSTGIAIENARIDAYKIIGGTEYLVEQVSTDQLGDASLFLNPNYYHRIVISYSGCNTIQQTRRITTSDSTSEFMSCGTGTGGAGFNLTNFENLTTSFLPIVNVRNTTESVNFSFTTSDSNCNLTQTRYILKYNGTSLINLTGNNLCGDTLSSVINLTNYSGTLIAYGTAYSNNQQVTLTKHYTVLNLNNLSYNQTSVKNLLDKIRDPTFGLELGLTPYSKAIICFLILFGLILAFGVNNVKDNVPIILIFINIFLWFFSYLGFLTVFSSSNIFINQYGLALLVSITSIGGIIVRRLL